HLPAEGQASSGPDWLAARSAPREVRRDAQRGPPSAAREPAGGPRARSRNGRRDLALRRRPARLRRGRVRPARPGPPPLDFPARDVRGSPRLAGGAPAVRSRALQRVSRLARCRRKVVLPLGAPLRGVPASARSSWAWAGKDLAEAGTPRSGARSSWAWAGSRRAPAGRAGRGPGLQ